MWDNNANSTLYPTDTTGVTGNTIDAFPYYPLAKNIQNLVNTSGYDCQGYGSLTITDPASIPQNQLSQAIASYCTLGNFYTASFVSNTYTLSPQIYNTGDTFAQAYAIPTILQNGLTFKFSVTNANTASVTVAIPPLTAGLPLLKQVSSTGSIVYTPLITGDLIPNQNVTIIYSATANSGSPAFVIDSPAYATTSSQGTIQIATQNVVDTGTNNTTAITPLTLATKQAQVALITYRVATNTSGGNNVGIAWTDRPLNTLEYDPYNIITSFASNHISLNIGKYLIQTKQIFFGDVDTVQTVQGRFRDITNSATIMPSLVSRIADPSGTSTALEVSTPLIYLNVTALTTYALQYFTSGGPDASGDGLGFPINSGESNIYASVEITKI